MQLKSAKIGPFKSINEPQVLELDPAVTVLVGMNEAGKTVVLQALEKSRDAVGIAAFDPVDDYPRKDLNAYLKRHETDPSTATILEYELTSEEVRAANECLNTKLKPGYRFTVSHTCGPATPSSPNIREKYSGGWDKRAPTGLTFGYM